VAAAAASTSPSSKASRSASAAPPVIMALILFSLGWDISYSGTRTLGFERTLK
jgi:hypothetical protein